MPGTCDGADVQIKIIKNRTQRPTGNGIGEIPFFLDVPANVDFEDAEERERAMAEFEHDKP